MQTYNVEVEQGATWSIDVELMEEGEETPMDLTGFTARAQFRSANLLDLHAALTGSQADPQEGDRIAFSNGGQAYPSRMTLTLSASATQALDFRSGVWELRVENSDGFAIRALAGTVTLSPSNLVDDEE